MALTDYAAFLAHNLAAKIYPFVKVSTATTSGLAWASYWTTAADAGAAPTTAAALSGASVGALCVQPVLNATTNTQYISQVDWLPRIASTAEWAENGYLLYDRLSHQGGLDGTVTTEQTTNLPTAALTRYTDGVGVMAALEIYTQIGSTATTATINYTNQAGTAARTSKAIVFGGTNRRNVTCFLMFPLQDADTGVRSVEGVTLAASTLTAGAFGVTLFKPLIFLPFATAASASSCVPHLNMMIGGGFSMPALQGTPCLAVLRAGMNTDANVLAVSGVIGAVKIIEVA